MLALDRAPVTPAGPTKPKVCAAGPLVGAAVNPGVELDEGVGMGDGLGLATALEQAAISRLVIVTKARSFPRAPARNCRPTGVIAVSVVSTEDLLPSYLANGADEWVIRRLADDQERIGAQNEPPEATDILAVDSVDEVCAVCAVCQVFHLGLGAPLAKHLADHLVVEICLHLRMNS
jgi:hypothetical protein